MKHRPPISEEDGVKKEFQELNTMIEEMRVEDQEVEDHGRYLLIGIGLIVCVLFVLVVVG
jgi:hypothetical protein